MLTPCLGVEGLNPSPIIIKLIGELEFWIGLTMGHRLSNELRYD